MDKKKITQILEEIEKGKRDIQDIIDLNSIVGDDLDYLKNYKEIKGKEISNLNLKEISTYVTCLSRSYHFSIDSDMTEGDAKIMIKVCERLLELC